MGRGRAKAKQTKVARELKYNNGPATDLDALERELSSDVPSEERHAWYEDPYADDPFYDAEDENDANYGEGGDERY